MNVYYVFALSKTYINELHFIFNKYSQSSYATNASGVWSTEDIESDITTFNNYIEVDFYGSLHRLYDYQTHIKYAMTPPIFKKCKGDFNEDGDVDGEDLFEYSEDEKGVQLKWFAEEFGRIDCD